MRAADFLLETLSHFIKLETSPPPGVPVHAGDEFEKELTALCQAQNLAPIVLDSFHKLSLTPRLSRIALQRLRAMAQTAGQRSARMLKLGSAVGNSFADANIDCLFIGELVAAAELYPAAGLRRIDSIELLVREADWEAIRALLDTEGFAPPPGARAVSTPGEALDYFQYVAPCVFRSQRGDAITLRFRMHAYGPPDMAETVWSRESGPLAGRTEIAVPPLEDRLMQSVLDWNCGGMTDMLLLVDIGLLLTRRGREIDWRYVREKLDENGFYAAFYLTLDYACRALKIRSIRALPARPGAIRRKMFKMLWYPGADAYMRAGGRGNPLKQFMFECGNLQRKMELLKRLIAPKDSWVSSFFDRPASAWLKVKFMVLLLGGGVRRGEAGARLEKPPERFAERKNT